MDLGSYVSTRASGNGQPRPCNSCACAWPVRRGCTLFCVRKYLVVSLQRLFVLDEGCSAGAMRTWVHFLEVLRGNVDVIET